MRIHNASVTGSLEVSGSFKLPAISQASGSENNKYLVLDQGTGQIYYTPQGAQGTQGTQGPQGANGYVGADGAQGATGAQGNQGPTGLQGTTGAQGNQGPQGIKGDQGFQGNQGPTGPQGVAGQQGNQGPTGLQGTTGSQGNQGPTGLQGTTGSQGNQGPTGLQGTNGAQGNQGPTGPQGVIGNQGNQGPTGPQGVAGQQGNQGPTGLQGVIGNQGNQGPQGIKGDQGFQGRQGPNGTDSTVAGPQGRQGPNGPQGDSGSVTGGLSLTTQGNANNTPSSPSANIGVYAGTYAFIDLSTQDSNGGWIDFSKGNGTDFAGRIRYYNNNDRFGFHTAGGSETITFNSTGEILTVADSSGASIKAQNNGNGNRWYGRIGSFNSTSDKSSFLGTYAGVAVVGAHNNALTAWAALHINNVDGSNGGQVYLPTNTYIASNVAIHAGNYSSYAVPLSGGTMSGQLRLNTPSNGVGSQLYIYSSSSHQYPQIFSDGSLEAMWNYRNSGSQWYVGLRTSTQLVGDTGFHFYNTTSAQTVGGYTVGGVHYSLGSAYANGNRLVENNGGSWNIVSAYATSMSVQWVGSMNVSTGSPTVYRVDNGVGAAVNYSPLLHMAASDTMWQLQGTYGSSGNGTLYFRQGYSGSWGNWITILSAANWTSYTDGRYWLNNGSWLADLGSYGFSRIFGNETSGGGFAIMTNPNNGGQTSMLIDGSYFAGENGGFWSLNSANNYTSRVGFYNDGTINFRTNSAVMSTNNVRIYPVSESWAEGISFIMPNTSVWGGLRWQRQRSTNDGNFALGYVGYSSSDDLVFIANNGGAQINDILRMTKAGLVSMQQAPNGATLVLGGVDLSRVYDDSARHSLVINAPYYPHLYLNATAGDTSNGTHGAVISMTGRLSSGGFRRWAMGIGNYDPGYFSIGWYDNQSNPHYGTGHSWGPGGKFVLDTSGNLTLTGDVTAYGASSDIRLKDIKGKVDNALEGVLKLNGYRFDWKEREVKIVTFKEDIGVVAQEVVDVFPELARTNEDGFMSVRYQGLTAVLIEAIKEQQQQIEDLKQQINSLVDNK